jgi:hypothetical protein
MSNVLLDGLCSWCVHLLIPCLCCCCYCPSAVFAAFRCRSRACISCCPRWHLWQHPRTRHNSRSRAAWTRCGPVMRLHYIACSTQPGVGTPTRSQLGAGRGTLSQPTIQCLQQGQRALMTCRVWRTSLFCAHNLGTPACLVTCQMFTVLISVHHE